jgi:hypothetical protein
MIEKLMVMMMVYSASLDEVCTVNKQQDCTHKWQQQRTYVYGPVDDSNKTFCITLPGFSKILMNCT